ncbi:DUF5050 domain-containing protein [Granulicella cerasi]|uniref:DUF5050 domain-containing protein n=1 Tax=Granulicella cerasi TaxID=741063 RepID=A0ABW1ZCE6_9BACT|nr:DUF5050 domain-containing protein [Granulicella cerasi]
MKTQSIGKLFILVARPPKLITMQSDGSDVQDLLADAHDTPDGIAVDAKNGFVYWTNMGANFAENDGYIQRMRLDDSNIETLIKPGQTYTPKQLVLDLPNDKMYWSDREGMRVMRANLDGSHIEVLVKTGSSDADRLDETRHCVGVAIDTKSKHIYWTQKGPPNGGKGRIFRAGLELPQGEEPAKRSDVELLFDQLPEPIDLELDDTSEYLYWTDRGDPPTGNSLNRAKLLPQLGGHEVLAVGLAEGIGIARAASHNAIFTSDLGGFIKRFNGPDFTTAEVIAELKQPLTGIAFQEMA